MIEDMYAVMQRINEIRSRFGLGRGNQHNHSANMKNNYEKFHTEALNNTEQENKGNKENRITGIRGRTVEEINKIAEYYANKNKISPSLVKAVIKIESGFNPTAVSGKGARGLMQLMPSVIKDFGVKNPFDIKENISAGVGLLKNLLKDYNWDYKKALSAYNAGKSSVDKKGGVPEYKETREYVKKVIESYLKNTE